MSVVSPRLKLLWLSQLIMNRRKKLLRVSASLGGYLRQKKVYAVHLCIRTFPFSVQVSMEWCFSDKIAPVAEATASFQPIHICAGNRRSSCS